ncbi:MAG: hypothetical protein EON98_13345 [Chitinophagaceae bacterium]|nr:MAG: hypothetical protein EON98_13345 [Chitinophagaceae bacterium]
METTTIIFDLGGVLIDWNPAYVFDKLIEDEEKRRYFFEKICTSEWNEEQDAGRTIKEATQLLVDQYPEWQESIEAYYGRWEEMLGGPIQETVDIFRQLKETGKYKFYALTNWSAELFTHGNTGQPKQHPHCNRDFARNDLQQFCRYSTI